MNRLSDAMLRIQISRGAGSRGYAVRGDERPATVMTVHPAPDQRALARWSLIVSSVRVAAGDMLAHHKTCSRMLQVIAATEARARGADEAVLINTEGNVAECGSSNLFWIEKDTVYTPPLRAGALPGITRGLVLERCGALGIASGERDVRLEQLREAEGVFLTFTSRGVVEAASLDGFELRSSPLTARLHRLVEEVIQSECA